MASPNHRCAHRNLRGILAIYHLDDRIPGQKSWGGSFPRDCHGIPRWRDKAVGNYTLNVMGGQASCLQAQSHVPRVHAHSNWNSQIGTLTRTENSLDLEINYQNLCGAFIPVLVPVDFGT